MTSLSDSQNIDLDPNGSGGPVLPPGSPLQVCPACEALLDISEREPLERIACPQCGAEMIVNGHIGNFQIVEVAGRGGMGVVYKAYDSSLDRYVALKLLRKDHSSDTKLIQQLETEASITASITDPNVVRVYGTGTDRQRFYLVMELVNKGSLDDLIHLQGRVAEAQVLQVGIQAAKGLRAALQHGLIHRDVKPGNILFSDAHSAKIVDFGLAIFMHQEESVRGEVWGTPYYVAPEKLDQQPEDFRSDMYSLGGSLFHALAGRPPFEAESASLVALKHLKNQPVSLQSFAPWVSNGTAHIINRTLSKDPAQRFQSYDELIDSFEYALEQLHAGNGAAAQRQRVALESEEDQKRWTWFVLALVAVVVLGAGGFFVSQQIKARKAAAAANTVQAAVRTGARYEPLQKPIEAFATAQKNAPELFDEAANNPALSIADRTWAELFKGAALLYAGKINDARTAFKETATMAPQIKDQAMADVIDSVAGRLSDNKPVAVTAAATLDTKGYEAASLLLYGIQDWQTGRTDDALTLFKQFRNADPVGTAEWISQFKPVAVDFIERQTAFQIWMDRLKSAPNPAERFATYGARGKLDHVFNARVEQAIVPYTQEIAKYRAEISKPPTAGIFRLHSRLTGKALEVRGHSLASGAGVGMIDPGTATHQFFKLVSLGGDTCKLVAVHSGKVLDVAGGGTTDGAKVQQIDDKDLPTQKWLIVSKGDGWFKLRNVGSGRFLAPVNDKRDNGIDVVVKSDHEAPELLWQFNRMATPVGEFTGLNLNGGKGSFEFKDNIFTIHNGSRDIAGTSDNYGFAFREFSGDFELVTQLDGITTPQNGCKAGLIVRQGLGADEPAVSLVATLDGNLNEQRRLKKGADTTTVKVPNHKLPQWLKLERKGEEVTSFWSADGQTWEKIGSDTIAGLKNPVYAGLAVTSHNPDKEVVAKFEHVKATPLK